MYHFAYGSTLAPCNVDQVLQQACRPFVARSEHDEAPLTATQAGLLSFVVFFSQSDLTVRSAIRLFYPPILACTCLVPFGYNQNRPRLVRPASQYDRLAAGVLALVSAGLDAQAPAADAHLNPPAPLLQLGNTGLQLR